MARGRMPVARPSGPRPRQPPRLAAAASVDGHPRRRAPGARFSSSSSSTCFLYTLTRASGPGRLDCGVSSRDGEATPHWLDRPAKPSQTLTTRKSPGNNLTKSAILGPHVSPAHPLFASSFFLLHHTQYRQRRPLSGDTHPRLYVLVRARWRHPVSDSRTRLRHPARAGIEPRGDGRRRDRGVATRCLPRHRNFGFAEATFNAAPHVDRAIKLPAPVVVHACVNYSTRCRSRVAATVERERGFGRAARSH